MKTVSEIVAQYNSLKTKVMPHASPSVERSVKKQMAELRNTLINTFVQFNPDNVIAFEYPHELISVIELFQDTGLIFGISWRRKTSSKSNPEKVAGSIDTMTVKKVNGYVKGTSGGKKQMENVLNDRLTLWVANGKLQNEGNGNWRTIYAKDLYSINIKGRKIRVAVTN